MKLASKYQIEKAASTDKNRFTINTVYFDNGHAIATDGRIMAIVPCEHSEEEQGKAVQAEDFSKVRKAQGAKASYVEGKLNGSFSATGKNGESYSYKLGEYIYPNYKQVIPQNDTEASFQVSFDANLLLKLAQAIGAGGIEKGSLLVTLTVIDSEKPILVKANNNKESFGVMMPVRIS